MSDKKKYDKPPCLNCKWYAGKCHRTAKKAIKCFTREDYPLYDPIGK